MEINTESFDKVLSKKYSSNKEKTSSKSKSSKYEYHFDPIIAHQSGIIDGSNLKSGHVVTQNNRGYQMSTLSPLYNNWINHKELNNFPIMDIGCAFGVNTLSALFKDNIPHVIAVDMTQSHLDYIKQAHKTYINEGYGYKQNSKVDTFIGILPQLEGFKDETISSILCAEVIHFLNGNELPIAFQRFYDVLIKGGELNLTCASANAYTKDGIDIKKAVDERKKIDPNNKWPGYFDGDDLKQFLKQVHSKWDAPSDEVARASDPSMLHFFTASQIAQLAENAGFLVKSILTGRHNGHPTAVLSDYSSIQLIAVKL